jgi:hypothetical protein
VAANGNYTGPGQKGNDPELSKRQAELLGRYATLYKKYINALDLDEMRKTFSELARQPHTFDGNMMVELAKDNMLRSLSSMQVDSLATIISDGYAEVVNSPIQGVLLSPTEVTRYISDVLDAVDLIDAQRVVLPITPFDSSQMIGCNQYGCKVFINR